MSPPGDMDGDGVVTGASGPDDLAAIAALINQSSDGYEKADIDLSGTIETADYLAIRSAYKDIAFGRAALSSVANAAGYKGCLSIALSAGGVRWSGRRRVLDSSLGRWHQRDPIKFGDGPSQYHALSGDPTRFMDPSGLQSEGGAGEDPNRRRVTLVSPGSKAVEADPGSGSGRGFVSSAPLPTGTDPFSFIMVSVGVATFSGCTASCEPCRFVGRLRFDIHNAGPESEGEFNNRWHGEGFSPDSEGGKRHNGKEDINWHAHESSGRSGGSAKEASGSDTTSMETQGADGKKVGTGGWRNGNPNVREDRDGDRGLIGGGEGEPLDIYPPHGSAENPSSSATYDINVTIPCGGWSSFDFSASGRNAYASARLFLSCGCCGGGSK